MIGSKPALCEWSNARHLKFKKVELVWKSNLFRSKLERAIRTILAKAWNLDSIRLDVAQGSMHQALWLRRCGTKTSANWLHESFLTEDGEISSWGHHVKSLIIERCWKAQRFSSAEGKDTQRLSSSMFIEGTHRTLMDVHNTSYRATWALKWSFDSKWAKMWLSEV